MAARRRKIIMPVILVTGSSTGIGRAAVLELERRGHSVWASMRDLGAAEALQKKAREESLDVKVVRLDVKGQPWPQDSAYQDTYRRTGAVFAASATEGSSVELVVQAIAAAFEDPSPRLRYPAGADAQRNLGGRAKLSDEEWGGAARPAACG